jgi:hypothetical protein
MIHVPTGQSIPAWGKRDRTSAAPGLDSEAKLAQTGGVANTQCFAAALSSSAAMEVGACQRLKLARTFASRSDPARWTGLGSSSRSDRMILAVGFNPDRYTRNPNPLQRIRPFRPRSGGLRSAMPMGGPSKEVHRTPWALHGLRRFGDRLSLILPPTTCV